MTRLNNRDHWYDHVRETLTSAAIHKKFFWISINGDKGYHGYVNKVSDFVFTITSEKGGTYHFFIQDILSMYDATTEAPKVETEYKGKN